MASSTTLSFSWPFSPSFLAKPVSSSSLSLPLSFSHSRRSILLASSSSSPPPSSSSSSDLPSVSTSYTSVCESEEDVECEILSGDWPESVSILNYEDLCKHYEPIILKEETQPQTFLANVMSDIKYSATPDQLLEEVDHCFLTISGLPVVNKNLQCIGVMSKKDRAKASKGLQSTVGEVMSSPPITLSADKTVNDAAILMLKKKIHRIPIVNEVNQLVGMVTRTDIFKAMESGSN